MARTSRPRKHGVRSYFVGGGNVNGSGGFGMGGSSGSGAPGSKAADMPGALRSGSQPGSPQSRAGQGPTGPQGNNPTKGSAAARALAVRQRARVAALKKATPFKPAVAALRAFPGSKRGMLGFSLRQGTNIWQAQPGLMNSIRKGAPSKNVIDWSGGGPKSTSNRKGNLGDTPQGRPTSLR